MRDFFAGKKTYIAAALMAIAGGIGWWFGAIHAAEASTIFAPAFGVAGLGAKATRYGDMTLGVLEEIRRVAALKAAGQKVDPAEIAAEVVKYWNQPGAVHITAGSTTIPLQGSFVTLGPDVKNVTDVPLSFPGVPADRKEGR